MATTLSRADFAAALYRELARRQPRDLFLSPFSIEVALAMCAAGAKGPTRQALADRIGAPRDVAEQHRHYAAALKAMREVTGVELTVANALWGQAGHPFERAYIDAVARYYDGALNEVDFRAAADQAVETINAWVLGKTRGKIKNLISREVIDSTTRLILTNAIYFKGKWRDPFDKSHTWDEDWHGPQGVRKVPMMQRRGGYDYFEGAEFQALELPYQGGALAMLLVLPHKLDGLAHLEAAWSADVYQRVTDGLAHEDPVIVSLPRFLTESEFRLKDVLAALGAGPAFSGAADFSGISSEPLAIAEVVHKAFVEVNEEGTEAAAATGVAMAKAAMVEEEPKSFVADHPFLYVIRHKATNAILFAGRVVEP